MTLRNKIQFEFLEFRIIINFEMTRKQSIKLILISSLIFLSLGGFLLHVRTHPPLTEAKNLIPFFLGIFSLTAIPLMFWFRQTLAYAYVINGFTVILGIITMAHFSIVFQGSSVTLSSILFKTTLPHISILLGKFFIGKAIFDLELLNTSTDLLPNGRFFRYPNMGWWLVHLVLLSVVYAAGNILWK